MKRWENENCKYYNNKLKKVEIASYIVPVGKFLRKRTLEGGGAENGTGIHENYVGKIRWRW